jgi:hypothetical protein
VSRYALVLLVVVALAAACGGGDDDGGDTAPCPDFNGMTRAEVEDAAGRPPNEVNDEDYGVDRTFHAWRFDGDEVAALFDDEAIPAVVVDWYFHDDGELTSERPTCPIPG